MATKTKVRPNRARLHDRAVHDWYRFVLSFPPELVQDYLRRFGIGGAQTVLDPFCGTGTTLVECKRLGIASIGIEANPLLHFASRVKIDWTPDPDALASDALRVAQAVQAQFNADGITDVPIPDNMRLLERPDRLRALPPDAEELLLKESISPLPLHKTLILLEQINHAAREYKDHERLALASVAVHSASNLRFGPEVGLGATRVDAPVIGEWLKAINTMAADLREVSAKRNVPATAYLADSRDALEIIPAGSIDAVITSPPYPNEKDYTRTTRLESVLLGFVRNKAELQTFKRGLVRSNTRNVYKGDDDDLWAAHFPQIQALADSIEARRKALGKTSGFERLYATVTRQYFGGMARHLSELRRILRPGAQLAYVVGDQASYLRVMIRTGQLLADIALTLGYEVVAIDLFRTRMATATKAQLREEVLVLRWPGN
ncbi:MAG: DNA methyltransferase [Aggregatilineales bacterium]